MSEENIPVISPGSIQRRVIDAIEPIIFVDARHENSWKDSDEKLPGAIRVPPDDAERFLNQVPQGYVVVVFSHAQHDENSEKVARILMDNGWTEVYTLDGGFEAWKAANLPLESKQESRYDELSR